MYLSSACLARAPEATCLVLVLVTIHSSLERIARIPDSLAVYVCLLMLLFFYVRLSLFARTPSLTSVSPPNFYPPRRWVVRVPVDVIRYVCAPDQGVSLATHCCSEASACWTIVSRLVVYRANIGTVPIVGRVGPMCRSWPARPAELAPHIVMATADMASLEWGSR